jgi:acid phosphatase (class A)
MPLLDMNMNMGFASSVGNTGRLLRPRYNSDVESRLVDTSVPANLVPKSNLPTPPPYYPTFHQYWDADLQSYMYLDRYITANPGWRAKYSGILIKPPFVKPQDMPPAQLGTEVLRILELALEREDRFLEVIDQDDADGAINYWLGMLKIDPARHPVTYLMVHVARRIGEHVVMCLKGDLQSPRPPQLCPAITPMIDPPATPSYPAGHAVQSYLISYLLAYSLADNNGNTNLPQTTLPAPTSAPNVFVTPGTQPTGPLFDLASRVSENRIVAGVHYPTDIVAGQTIAANIFTDLQGVASVWGAAPSSLQSQVKLEFPQYAL